MSQLVEIGGLRGAAGRQRLEQRARRLAWAGNAWHLVELGVALGAGIAAHSIALVGFALDSFVEIAAGLVVVWLFSPRVGRPERRERLAQRLVAGSFFLLAAYVAAEAIDTLVGGDRPRTSWIGVGLAAVAALTMPLLARAKRRVGRRLGSAAAVSESGQNLLCAYLAVALLAGLLANAVAGWWWADPAAALSVAAVAVREGIEGWRGDACCEVCAR